MTPEQEREAAEAAQERYEAALSRARSETAAQVPPRYAGADATDPGVIAWIESVAAAAREHAGPGALPVAGRGPSLLLSGVTGTGKTRSAYGAMLRLNALGIIARWRAVTAADLYAMLRPRHEVDSEAEFRSVARAPVLIVDDIAAAKSSEWTEEVNYRLVNYRYEHEAVTLFATNAPPSRLPSLLGERVASRLTEMAAVVILKGTDRRLAR